MKFFKNITYDKLLDIATEIVEKYSDNKEEDLSQIYDLKKHSGNKLYQYFGEGWVYGLSTRYNVSVENYLRKEKLEKINKIK